MALTYFQLRRDYNLTRWNKDPANPDGLNAMNQGMNEKWFGPAKDTWFFILPNGELRQMLGNGSTIHNNTLIQAVGVEVYNDPSLIYNAPPDVVTPPDNPPIQPPTADLTSLRLNWDATFVDQYGRGLDSAVVTLRHFGDNALADQIVAIATSPEANEINDLLANPRFTAAAMNAGVANQVPWDAFGRAASWEADLSTGDRLLPGQPVGSTAFVINGEAHITFASGQYLVQLLWGQPSPLNVIWSGGARHYCSRLQAATLEAPYKSRPDLATKIAAIHARLLALAPAARAHGINETYGPDSVPQTAINQMPNGQRMHRHPNGEIEVL